MEQERRANREPRRIPDDAVEIVPQGSRVPAQRDPAVIVARETEELIKAVDPQLVEVYKREGVRGILAVVLQLERSLAAEEHLTRKAASFYPAARAQVQLWEHERATPKKNPDARTTRIMGIYELIDKLSGAGDFLQSIGAERGSDGKLYIEGIEQPFLMLLPLPSRSIVLGSIGNVPGRANLLFVNTEKRCIANDYQYILVAPIGEYILGMRPTLGSAESTVELINPATGKAWFGQDGRFREFVQRGNGLYGVLKNSVKGKREIKVPPPPGKDEASIKELPGDQKSIPESIS